LRSFETFSGFGAMDAGDLKMEGGRAAAPGGSMGRGRSRSAAGRCGAALHSPNAAVAGV